MLEILVASVVIAALVWVFFIPLNLIRRSDSFIADKNLLKVRAKRSVIEKLPPPYPNGWYVLAQSSEIQRGTSRSFTFFGETFVVFRSSESGEVFVLDAFCPHLGANLGIGGKVDGDCIRCPFHDWKFSGVDGSCKEIPYSKSLSEFEKSAKLKKWKSQEVNGLIFVWYHAENEDPWQIPHFDQLDSGEWILHGNSEFIAHCHIQDIVENSIDLSFNPKAHFYSLHGTSVLAGSDIRSNTSSWLSIGTHLWDLKWEPDFEHHHMTSQILHHVLKLWKFKLFDLTANMKQCGPSFVYFTTKNLFGSLGGMITMTPISPLKVKIRHYFYAPRHLSWYMKPAMAMENINFQRDLMIWNHKKLANNPLLPKEDKFIKQHRLWFGQFYTENSKSMTEATKDVSW